MSGLLFPRIEDLGLVGLQQVRTQLQRSQWWSSRRLRQAQFQQLQGVIRHAARHSPGYAQRLSAVADRPLDEDTWHRIPILERSDLQQADRPWDCRTVPAAHGPVRDVTTSGSTARPVTVRDTALGSLLWNALGMRDHDWHPVSLPAVLAAIRWRGDGLGAGPDGLQQSDWGPPLNLQQVTGPGWFLNSATDIAAQVTWLRRVRPHYLITHPSNLRALLNELGDPPLPGLRRVRTVGEVVDPALRDQVQAQLGVPLVDMYSAQELGYIALQCPHHAHYHVQSEHVYLEVLRDNGDPCESGETGRIVVTSLHHFATPLIRYAIGDHGSLGPACPCGRGLPVLERIQGRVRNLLRRPDGSVSWPNFGFGRFASVAPLRQFQVVQTALDAIEFRVVPGAPLDATQRRALADILQAHLGPGLTVSVCEVPSIPVGPGGKFEDFLSLL